MTFRKHFRLLPVLTGMCGLLLVIKLVGVSEYAYAEAKAAADAPKTEKASAPTVTARDLADDGGGTSKAELDVLVNLAERRRALEARTEHLGLRENLIEAAEKRIDGKIAQLRQLEQQMQKLLGQRDAEQSRQLLALVKTYSTMKPADAARIFNGLGESGRGDDILVSVAAQMKPDILAPILAKMPAGSAQKLTLRLANRLDFPEAPKAETSPTPAAAAPVTAETVSQIQAQAPAPKGG